MLKEKIYEDLTLVQKRARIAFLALAIILAGVLFYYWKIQVLDHRKFFMMAEANRLRERVLPAARGVIRDRNAIILADNKAGFKVSLIRENMDDYGRSCLEISSLLGLEKQVLEERIAKYANVPKHEPIVIKDNLGLEEVSRVEARKYEFPELVVEAEPKRFYPFGKTGAHVLGYLQELTPEEIKSSTRKQRHPGDLGGKTGIEKEYDTRLIGTDGKIVEIVDNLGKSRGEMSRIDPGQGEDIRLTLDFDLQKKAEELLQDREGAVVVLDVRRGGILAMASYPTYDPNQFISRFSPAEWSTLINDPNFPLENRAIRGLYSPGSLFKPVIALAGLDAGLRDERTTSYCSGAIEIYGHPFNCWFRSGHGSMNLANAVKNSCNIYFYTLGKILGIERISQYARMLGLGQKTGVDIPGEKEGLVGDPGWKMKTSKTAWFPGETISVSIGQGPLLVTPLQAACLTALIAGRGKQVRPHLFEDAFDILDPGASVPIAPAAFEKVIEGMWRSVNDEGTGRWAKVDGLDICGKTGSTQTVSTERAEVLSRRGREIKTHSWFSGFAPRTNPRAVVTVLVEFGGMGGATAAPLAREIFDLYSKKHVR
jgi:penicillin-binding protein 2